MKSLGRFAIPAECILPGVQTRVDEVLGHGHREVAGVKGKRASRCGVREKDGRMTVEVGWVCSESGWRKWRKNCLFGEALGCCVCSLVDVGCDIPFGSVHELNVHVSSLTRREMEFLFAGWAISGCRGK